MCLAEFSVYSNLKPCASTDRIVDLPQVTSCGPGPVSPPGAFISCGYFPGGLVGPMIALAQALTLPTISTPQWPRSGAISYVILARSMPRLCRPPAKHSLTQPGKPPARPAIIDGRAGGFPGWVNECFAGGRQSRGIERAKITYEIAPDLGHWGVEIVGKVKAWAKAIIGPTSPPGKYPQLMNAPGSETGPGPQLVTWGKSTILSVDALGFKFEYTLNSAKHIPFDWVGP